MKVRILVRPSGLLNGQEWPEVGETIDLPEAVAKGMAEAGDVEIVKAQPAKKAAAKSDDEKPVEKRPASKADVEKRSSKKS